MKRYLETFFRHKLLFVLPVVVAFVAATYYEYSAPRQWQTTASIWADSPLPGGSSITNGIGAEAPSTAQAAVLSELLQTHNFLLAVARHSPLAGFVATHSPTAVDRLLGTLAGAIKVSEPGPQIINVVVQQKTPAMAVGLATALVNQYRQAVIDQLQARGRAQAAYDAKQVGEAQAALNKAESELASYTAADPSHGTSAATSSTQAQLTTGVLSAEQQLSSAQQAYGQATAGLTNMVNASTFSVADPPSVPTKVSRAKRLILAAAGGLLGGLLISILAMAAVVGGDKSLREEGDIESQLGLHVVGSARRVPRPRRWANRSA